MNVQRIQGELTAASALDLFSQMIQAKIEFQENQISKLDNEEDIKAKESKIKALQHALSEMRAQLAKKPDTVNVAATISIF
jgi:SMC interacting uncharacterized protein involved in chromosome segregation